MKLYFSGLSVFLLFSYQVFAIPQWKRMTVVDDWEYRYWSQSIGEPSDNYNFDLLENGFLLHLENDKINNKYLKLDIITLTEKGSTKINSFQLGELSSPEYGIRYNNSSILKPSDCLFGAVIFLKDMGIKLRRFTDDDIHVKDFAEDLDGLLRFRPDNLFFVYPFVFWVDEEVSGTAYSSLELLENNTWKYRNNEETMRHFSDSSSKTSITTDGTFLFDGDRLIASTSSTLSSYFGDSVGNLIGVDADGNYYTGFTESIGVRNREGRLLRQITTKAYKESDNTLIFPVRVDPFGVCYTIRFNEENRTVELWKLDPGVLSEERRYEIAATARSEFYEKLCALNGQVIVQTADVWGIPEGRLTESGVRVRSEPSTEAEIITKIDAGTAVRVIGRSETMQKIGKNTAYWYKIGFGDGTIGWAFGAFIDVKEPDQIRISASSNQEK